MYAAGCGVAHDGRPGADDASLADSDAIADRGVDADEGACADWASPPGTIVVDDRGYNEYRLFAKWTEAQVFFAARMKDNAQFEVVEDREPPRTATSSRIRRFA